MLNNPSVADFKSGFLIFLLALPLCLGISIASSFPPIAGILTAMVGGLIGSFLGSARHTIKGPAAGLIVVVLGAVQELGGTDLALGYKRCLGVCVVAAIFQIIFAKLKAAKLGYKVPSSVIHGMLAAIGVIIVAKQLHVLLGVIPHGKAPLQLLAEIPDSFASLNPRIAFLGLLTLGILLAWPFLPIKSFKKLPAALVALLLVMPFVLLWNVEINQQYVFMDQDYQLGPDFLVTIPSNILSSLSFPDFSGLMSFVGWKYVIMLSLIGSLESTLTVMAMDSLDKEKQASDLNKDLFATGAANLIAALIGGLPMISEVVRSKANIDYGAKSPWSNFFHAAFLLLAITLIPGIIHEIPLTALAAMLIVTGFRLASPKQFYHAYQNGGDQLMLFCTTLFVTLATDLLMGVLAGLALQMLLKACRGAK